MIYREIKPDANCENNSVMSSVRIHIGNKSLQILPRIEAGATPDPISLFCSNPLPYAWILPCDLAVANPPELYIGRTY